MITHSITRTSILLALTSLSQAATVVMTDSYDQADSFNIRDFTSRQVMAVGSNITAPVGFLTNAVSPAQPTNYHEQIQGNKLLMAGDTSIGTFDANPLLNTFGLSLVALNKNFNGLTGATFADGILAQCGMITLTLDAMTNAAPSTYGYASIIVGGAGLTGSGTGGFSARFIEDNNFGNGNFIQLYDGATLLQNLLPNPAGAGAMNIEMRFSDADNHPWNGVGATSISLFVNGSQVGSTFTKSGGGFSNNFITFEGSEDFVGNTLGIHTFDNFQMSAVSPIPEPSTALLGGLGLLASGRRRRLSK